MWPFNHEKYCEGCGSKYEVCSYFEGFDKHTGKRKEKYLNKCPNLTVVDWDKGYGYGWPETDCKEKPIESRY